MENEAVNTYLLVARNADLLNESFLVAKRAKRRHEPAVAIVPLTNIIGSSAFEEERGILEDVLKLISWRFAQGSAFCVYHTSILFTEPGNNRVTVSSKVVKQSGGYTRCLKSVSISK